MVLKPEFPGAQNRQRPDFEGEYKYPLTHSRTFELSDFLSPTILESSIHQDLPIPPPKFIDLWRIGGEGPDLHLHRRDLHFSPIHLGISWLGFPVGKPSSPLLYSWCYLDLLWSLTFCGLLGSPQFSCGCVPQAFVRDSISALKGDQ